MSKEKLSAVQLNALRAAYQSEDIQKSFQPKTIYSLYRRGFIRFDNFKKRPVLTALGWEQVPNRPGLIGQK